MGWKLELEKVQLRFEIEKVSAMKDHISVCICTLHRKEMLARLLHRLAVQQTDGLFDVSIVIVDNDSAGSARDTVLRIKNGYPFELRYDIEPEKTIPAARNHALRLAKGNYIAILDDDEFPPANWLLTLYQGIQTFNVDGALGPIYPFFENQPPTWLLASKLCDLPTYRTGTLLRWKQTRTGNVLLRKNVIDTHGIYFDEAFQTGGSDQVFFRRAIDRGYRFVAVEEAPLYETVPPERWTRKYFLKRAAVNGFNSYRYALLEKRRYAAVALTLRSFFAFGSYAFMIPLFTIVAPDLLMKYLEKSSYHLSRLCAAAGIEIWRKRDF